MKRALGWAVNVILIWLIVIVVALFLLPRFGGWRFDAVLSGSMEPALPVGGVVFIKPVEPADIGPGDIIAYRSGELLITHRIVDVIDEGELSFITKGDANESPDLSPVPAASVVGKVIFDVPYLGYLAAFVKTPLGFLLAIVLPGLAIIGLELKNLWQVVLKKETARASPQVESKAAPPLKPEKPLAAVEGRAQAESKATGLVKTEKSLVDANTHSKIGAFLRSPLADKVAIGVAIGAAVGIIAILTIVFLVEVL